ncbi:MAG TPA: efflux RND transporter periplasmic adaptor subunit [Caldithrix abyssi]|uniref:Efflux RND transporter periplasmic adaptor subunit n=1 Tax=Caldithrix abyssi TaxID=187145 RepID=A0A7V5PQC1_CALAY|nr:efflux RND transporter periplasmic adaptor subunit [Caldithrix abyssi]
MIFRITIIMLSGLLFWWGCRSQENPNRERIVPVSVLTVHPDSISTFVEITGNLEAGRDALVLSQTSERLMKIEKPVGSHVQADEVIARLDNRLLEQAMRQAEAALQQARARYENVKSDYDRYQRLYQSKAISDQQWQKMKSGLQEAEAGLQQMEAAYAQAKERYENSFIKAPFSGIVGSFYFEVGQMIPMGQPVAKIINPGLMKAKLYVPDIYFGRIKLGQLVHATFPVIANRTFTGRIIRIDPAIDPMSRTQLAEVSFENRDRALTSGMYGLFKIKLAEKKHTIVVPDNAILTRTEVKINSQTGETFSVKKNFVFVVQADSAKMVQVEKGLAYGNRVEITRGLRVGDRVVVVGQFSLKDGEKVTIGNE